MATGNAYSVDGEQGASVVLAGVSCDTWVGNLKGPGCLAEPRSNASRCYGHGVCSNLGVCSCSKLCWWAMPTTRRSRDTQKVPYGQYTCECSGHGKCNRKTGLCSCFGNFALPDCAEPGGTQCPRGVDGICSGHGFCTLHGFCSRSDAIQKVLVATEAIVVRTVQFQLQIIRDVVVKSTHVQVTVNAVLMAFVT